MSIWEKIVFISRMSYTKLNEDEDERLLSPAPAPAAPRASLMNRFLGGREERLVKAAEEGNLKLVKELLERGAQIEGPVVRIGMYDDGTPLLRAVKSNHLDVVEFLLTKGANPNSTTSSLNTPLISTIKDFNSLPMVKILLDDPRTIINKHEQSGKTALMFAAMSNKSNSAEIVELLCQRGADKHILDKNKRKAYDYATTDDMRKLLTTCNALPGEIDKQAKLEAEDIRNLRNKEDTHLEEQYKYMVKKHGYPKVNEYIKGGIPGYFNLDRRTKEEERRKEDEAREKAAELTRQNIERSRQNAEAMSLAAELAPPAPPRGGYRKRKTRAKRSKKTRRTRR